MLRRHLSPGTGVLIETVPTVEREVPEEGLAPLPELLGTGEPEAFRYCLNTSTLRGHGLPLGELVDITAAAGFEGIEPWIDELEKYSAEGGDLSELGDRIRDLGLSVEGGIGFFEWVVDDEALRAEGLRKARHAMELLARLGGKRIAAPAFGAHTADAPAIDLLAAADRYRALLDIGDRTGVVPMVEVWGFSKNIRRMGEGLLIAAESDHPSACLLADIYHIYKGGSSLLALRHLSAEAIGLFHINDYPNIPPADITDADRVYPGDGIAPLTPLFRCLSDIGYDRFLSLELFNKDYYREDPLTVARTGLEKLRAAVDKAFSL
ncbi:MAG: sugar phosphate isomerase/epimerase [Capsulimonadales bacterium]|nr:sugar phosphate isomerase/epimerase [Capsulimonadales bacterium]